MILGRIYLFGSLQLIPGQAEDAPLEIRSAKLQALLAYLGLHHHRPINRHRLGRALWPRTNESTARRNLREYLYRARQALDEFIPGANMIDTEDNFITFNPPPECWIDLVEFECLTNRARQLAAAAPTEAIPLLRQAIDLYRTDLLANLYDDWVMAEREQFRASFIDNLAQLSQLLQISNRLTEAITMTERLLEHDPLREEDHRRLMELYLASGDRARALQQYQLCCQVLSQELAAEPMPETQAIHQAILEAAGTPVPSITAQPRPERGPQPAVFVGRQAELARLTMASIESRAGPTKINIVTGESGLGKTRLITEWLSGQPLDTTLLSGQSHEFEQDIPYRPLLDALQQSLHLMPWKNLPPESTYTWLAPLAQLMPDLYYHLPELSPTAPQADGDTSYHVMEGLAQLFLGFARRSPVILFMDDLHWADLPTWRFLPFLARRAQQAPLFIVGTFCPPEAQRAQLAHLRSLEQSDLARLLPLSRLWLTDIGHLVSQMLNYPAEKLTPLIQRLHQETQGNPFYAIEMVKALAESGLSPAREAKGLDQLPLPSAIQTLIENRLDRLEPENRQALCTAAVIGRAFGFYLLADVSQVNEDKLLDYLDNWLERGLIVEQSPGRYDFSHPRVREVAYSSLSRPRRRRTHYRIARALENAYPADVERVAYHDSFSDQPARAITNLLEVGQRALNLRSYQEAHKTGQTLLKILQQLPEPDSVQNRLERNLQLAQAFYFTGDMAQALPILEDTAGLAETLADTSQVGEIALRMAQVYWLRGDAPQTRLYAERALAMMGQNATSTQRATILRLLGRVNVAQGNFENAVSQLKQSLLLEAGLENPLNQGTASGYLAIALAYLGHKAEAIAALKRAQQIALRIESLTALAVARVRGSVAYSALEMWDEADSLASIGLADCEAQDLPVYAFVARSVLGRAAHYKGDDETAYHHLRAAIAWVEANQYLLFRHMAHVYLAEVALACGDVSTVREQAYIALELANRTDNCWTKTRVKTYLRQLEDW